MPPTMAQYEDLAALEEVPEAWVDVMLQSDGDYREDISGLALINVRSRASGAQPWGRYSGPPQLSHSWITSASASETAASPGGISSE